MSNAEIISAIESMTILELADLVKEMEEKFGVSAAAPVVVGGGAAAAAEESGTGSPPISAGPFSCLRLGEMGLQVC